MESSKYMYSRLEVEDLPEPDYFEIQLEKIYEPPPTRLRVMMRWTRRNLVFFTLLAAFLITSILYFATTIPTRPTFPDILRAQASNPKPAGTAGVQIEVSGSDVVNTDGDDLVLNGSSTNVTFSSQGNNGSPTNVTIDQGLVETPTNVTFDVGNNGLPTNITIEQGVGATATPKNTTTNQPTKPAGQKDPGKVSIQPPTAAEKEPFVPVQATFYSGSEGPKACRGHAIAVIDLAKPQASGVPGPIQCYNFPNLAASGCATFKANKVDGCLASVFAETDCRTYMNTAAFMPENRPVGGNWRSVKVQCGLPEPDPATLGKPPMMDSITGMVNNDKKKGG